MKTQELGEIVEDDDIILQIEQFKMGLMSRATGGDFEQKEYSRLRKLVLGIPGVERITPRFLKICRTTGEFWGYIQGEAPSCE